VHPQTKHLGIGLARLRDQPPRRILDALATTAPIPPVVYIGARYARFAREAILSDALLLESSPKLCHGVSHYETNRKRDSVTVSSRIESKSRRYRSARTVQRTKSVKISLSEARLIAGVEWERGLNPGTRRSYRKGIPTTKLANDLYAWWLGKRGEVPAGHRCDFLDFTAMVGGLRQMRRVVLALLVTDDLNPHGAAEERRRVEALLDEALHLQKREMAAPDGT